jgi:hypothetical protein
MVSLVLNSSVADCKRDAAVSGWFIVIPAREDYDAAVKEIVLSVHTMIFEGGTCQYGERKVQDKCSTS